MIAQQLIKGASRSIGRQRPCGRAVRGFLVSFRVPPLMLTLCELPDERHLLAPAEHNWALLILSQK